MKIKTKVIKRFSDKFPALKDSPEYRAAFLAGRAHRQARKEGRQGEIPDSILVNKEAAWGWWDAHASDE